MAEISAAGDAPSTDEKDAQNSTTQTRKPPVFSVAMLRRDMGDQFTQLDVNEVTRRVYKGVLLKDDEKQGQEDQEKSANQDHLKMISSSVNRSSQAQPYKHKYWVDRKLNRSCSMVLAPDLSIAWGNNSQYWTWPEEEESCHQGKLNIHVAELQRVCWLEIKGKCKTIVLSQRTMYEVAIFVKMSSQSSGWEIPVNLRLELPDGNRQVREKRLDELEKGKWIPISIGKFETTPKTHGEISFSLTQTDERQKSGLRVKGVAFTSIAAN